MLEKKGCGSIPQIIMTPASISSDQPQHPTMLLTVDLECQQETGIVKSLSELLERDDSSLLPEPSRKKLLQFSFSQIVGSRSNTESQIPLPDTALMSETFLIWVCPVA